MDAIPLEVRQIILHQSESILSPSVDHVGSQALEDLLLSSITVSSSTVAQSLLRAHRAERWMASVPRSLTVQRGNGRKMGSASRKRMRGGEPATMEDSVTELELVQLVAALRSLEELHLRELAFASLRRRSLGDLVSGLSTSALHTLSICGRPASPSQSGDTMFNLHTVGQLVQNLPHLRHLALRWLSASPSSLEHLSYPSCTLDSFALYSTPNLTPKHLHWLLRSTCHAETLRTLALEWNDSPKILKPIRYTVLRLEELHLTTDSLGVVESICLHCPSLLRLAIKAGVPVDAARLFLNLERPLLELSDRSIGENGVDLRMLGAVLDSRLLKYARKLERVALIRGSREELGRRILPARVQVEALEVDELDVEEPWVPSKFASLRRVRSMPGCA